MGLTRFIEANAKTAAKHGATVGLRVLGALCVLGLTAWITRRYGASAYGAFAFMGSIGGLIGWGSQFGLEFFALRELPLSCDSECRFDRWHYHTSLAAIGVISSVVSVLVCVMSWRFRPEVLAGVDGWFFVAACPGVVLSPLNFYNMHVFNAAGQASRGYAVDRIAFALGVLVIAQTAILLGRVNPTSLALAFSGANLALFALYTGQVSLGFIAAGLAWKKSRPSIITTRRLQFLRSAIHNGWLASIAQLLDQAGPLLMTVFVGRVLSATDTAIVAVALSLAGGVNLITQAFETSLLSPLRRALGGSCGGSRAALVSVCRQSSVFALCVSALSIVAVLLAGKAILSLMGPGLVAGAQVLLIVLLAIGARSVSLWAQDLLLLSEGGHVVAVWNGLSIGLLVLGVMICPKTSISFATLYCGIQIVRTAGLWVVALRLLRFEMSDMSCQNRDRP